MSIKSFILNTAKDPAYAFRRINWEFLQLREEKTVSRRSALGKMSFSSKDQVIGRCIYLTGEFSFTDVQKIVQFLVSEKQLTPKDNALLLDIGANIGPICIPAVKQGYFSRAIAFEPEEKNRFYLTQNRAQNHLESQITIYPYGLSHEDSDAYLKKSDYNFGDHQVVLTPSEKTVSVRVRKLDRVLEEEKISPENISLIWMDTQGYEGHILDGASQVLNARVPLVTEFWPHGLKKAGTDPVQFCERLASYYDYFLDFRDPEFKKRSMTELKAWINKYTDHIDDYTDFLCVKDLG